MYITQAQTNELKKPKHDQATKYILHTYILKKHTHT